MEEQHYDVTQLLSDDLLADVLARLAPRWLAASRSVCKAWRAVIDTRRLLRADLLPLSLAGIYLNFYEVRHSVFLSRPSTCPAISGMFTDYTPDDNLVHDHCNGLLLLWSGVANPATRQWTPVPEPPAQHVWMDLYRFDNYLVFDPTVSPHYEIFQIPRIHSKTNELYPLVKSTPWPPSRSLLQVFSSRTGQWGERWFVREGDAAGTIADMATEHLYDRYSGSGVYWQGALYVHCQTDFVMRISLSDNKYQVINLPMNTKISQYKNHVLGRSMRGVHYALMDKKHRLRVWFLKKSCGQMTWELTHDKDLGFLLRCQEICIQNDGPWTLHYKNYFGHSIGNGTDNYYEAYKKYIARRYCYEYDSVAYKNHCEDIKKDVVVRVNKFEWDSDNDDILDTTNPKEGQCRGYLSILGFHPYKEIIFLNQEMKRGLAYHFNSSKVQNLGSTFPKPYDDLNIPDMYASFMYTPCWI